MLDHFTRKFRLRPRQWLHRSQSRGVMVRRFSYKDIRRATDDFHKKLYSSSADGAAAYRAKFKDDGFSMVKVIEDFNKGNDVFYKEIQLLERLHHRHLLALKGFSTGRKRLLVFDNIENGSLKEHLDDPLRTPLNWKTRLQIAVGVAAALEYLFIFSNPPVYNVSISSANIMLDENFTAKISDISLLNSVQNDVKLPGASCSEEGCVNIVFQLGVLILELITGQSSEEGGADLSEWVQGSRVSSSIYKIVDPDLGDFDSKELKKLLAVAKLCIKSKDKPTPFSVTHILRFLQKKIEI